MTEILNRICASRIGLCMPRAIEALDRTVRKLERGELSALEALDGRHLRINGLRGGLGLARCEMGPFSQRRKRPPRLRDLPRSLEVLSSVLDRRMVSV